MLNKLSVVMSFFVVLFSSSALADGAVEAAGAAAQSAGSIGDGGIKSLAAGMAIGLAVMGGALGQSKAASSALEGMGRNPAAAKGLFTPMIISLALIESLVILAFVIAMMVK